MAVHFGHSLAVGLSLPKLITAFLPELGPILSGIESHLE